VAQLEPLNSFTSAETTQISPFDMRLCDVMLLPILVVGDGVSVRRWLECMMSKEMMIWSAKLLSAVNTKLIPDEHIVKRNL
jgi:hypothetical protein